MPRCAYSLCRRPALVHRVKVNPPRSNSSLCHLGFRIDHLFGQQSESNSLDKLACIGKSGESGSALSRAEIWMTTPRKQTDGKDRIACGSPRAQKRPTWQKCRFLGDHWENKQ